MFNKISINLLLKLDKDSNFKVEVDKSLERRNILLFSVVLRYKDMIRFWVYARGTCRYRTMPRALVKETRKSLFMVTGKWTAPRKIVSFVIQIIHVIQRLRKLLTRGFYLYSLLCSQLNIDEFSLVSIFNWTWYMNYSL